MDFTADVPFGQVSGKLKEHYGIEVPTSSARGITLTHAAALTDKDVLPAPPKHVVHLRLVSEVDGSMIPIVSRLSPGAEPGINEDGTAKKTTREWREARLNTTRPDGCIAPLFGATTGNAQAAGAMMKAVASAVGVNGATRIHGVGDGARWIAQQYDEQFGSRSSYLLDLYHVCEYLADAAKACAPEGPRAWVELQKTRLKEGALAAVIAELNAKANHGQREEPDPVYDCLRYLSNRPGQLNYPSAIALGLPIGSGEIESANKYIVQARLKLAGAWWAHENATSMLQLRVLRGNNQWDSYWTNLAKAA